MAQEAVEQMPSSQVATVEKKEKIKFHQDFKKSCCLKLGCFENCLKNERRHLPPKVITLKIF